MKNFSKLTYALVLGALVSLSPVVRAASTATSTSTRSAPSPAPISRPSFTTASPSRSNLDSPRESNYLGMRRTDPAPVARVESPKVQSEPTENKPSGAYGMRRVEPSTTAAAPNIVSPLTTAPSSAVANDNKPTDTRPSSAYGMRRVEPSTATIAPSVTAPVTTLNPPSTVANDNKSSGTYGMHRVEPSTATVAPIAPTVVPNNLANDNKPTDTRPSGAYGMRRVEPSTAAVTPALPSVTAPSVANKPVQSAGTLNDPVARQLHSQMGADSARKFAEDRKRAQMPATPVVPAEVARNDNFQSARRDYSNMDDYYRARSNAQDEYRRNNQGSWQNSSTWAQRLRPNYGPYDGLMLASIVANVVSTGVNAYSIWAYSHRNEGWYQNWHSDMQREASNNPDLQSKLNELDQQVRDLTAKGAATEAANSLPPGWSPASAIAPEVFGGMLGADSKDTKPMVMADNLELPAPSRVLQPSTSPFDTVGMNKVSDHVDGSGKWAYMAVFFVLLAAVAFFYFSRKR